MEIRNATKAAAMQFVGALAVTAAACSASALERQADWQTVITGTQPKTPIAVRSVEGDSPAARAGLRAGDQLLTINGVTIKDSHDLFRARHRSKYGSEVVFAVDRGGARFDVRFTPRETPYEQHPGSETIYGSASTAKGFEIRLITTRPAGAGKWPAIVFIPWLSCDSVDYPRGAPDGWGRMLFELIRSSQSVVVRIEKAGVGDSTGPSCMDADLEDDLAGFRAGLKAVGELPYVDANNLFLFGGSIGAALVPILAREIPVKGIIASGGFYKTWLEHMLELERRRLTLSNRTPGDVNAALRGYADFYSLYLNGKATPAEVGARRPELASLWYDLPAHQYGRPARYYHQVQGLNVAQAWSAIDVPVLVVYGEYDWIMSREDQELLVAVVNGRRPNSATLIVVPRMGHNIETFASMAKAFEDDGGEYASSVAADVLRWIRTVATRGR